LLDFGFRPAQEVTDQVGDHIAQRSLRWTVVGLLEKDQIFPVTATVGSLVPEDILQTNLADFFGKLPVTQHTISEWKTRSTATAG
jgi:hypothetical protein